MSHPKEALDDWTDVDDAGQLSLATAGDQLALLLDVDDAHQEHADDRPARGTCAACEYDHPHGAPCRALTLTEREAAA